MNDDALRQLMLGLDPASGNGTPPTGTNPFANPFAGFPGMAGLGAAGQGGASGEEDPMMKMLQQMMGGGFPGADAAGGMPPFPGMPSQPMPGNTTNVDPYAYLWRIVHAVFALSLGFYIILTSPFNGTKLSRDLSTTSNADGTSTLTTSSIHFFYIFATMEVLLQSSRFWLEKGRVQQGGILGTIQGFLPEPWKGYLGMILRYARIWTTVSADAMVCVFVLGACAWWQGAVVA